jgi:hypothetical protein
VATYIRSRADGEVIRNPSAPLWITHQRVTVRCDDGSTLDCGGAEFGIRGADGCHGLKLEGLNLTNAGHGCRITNARGVIIVGVKSHHNGAEGLQGGPCQDLVIEDTECWENGTREGVDSFYAHKGHGVYFSGAGVVLRRVRAWENDGCGAQARGDRWQFTDCEFTRNLIGSGVGAPDLQLNGVWDATLIRCLIAEGNGGLTLHNEERPCKEILARDCAIFEPAPAKFAVNGIGAALTVKGGLVVGKLMGTPPAFSADVFRSPTATPAALAALAAWKGGVSPNPEPTPPTDEGGEAALWRSRWSAERLRAEQAEASLAELRRRVLVHARELEEAGRGSG